MRAEGPGTDDRQVTHEFSNPVPRLEPDPDFTGMNPLTVPTARPREPAPPPDMGMSPERERQGIVETPTVRTNLE